MATRDDETLRRARERAARDRRARDVPNTWSPTASLYRRGKKIPGHLKEQMLAEIGTANDEWEEDSNMPEDKDKKDSEPTGPGSQWKKGSPREGGKKGGE